MTVIIYPIVSGVVKYAIDKPTEYKDITLSLIGKGHCTWTERDSTSSSNDNTTTSSKTTTYYGHDEYVNHKMFILEKSKNVSTIVVPPGCYEFPFQFILPKNIPPSFKDTTCKITYEVVLEFVKPRLINATKKFDAELSVYGYVTPTLSYPIVFGLEKSLFKPFSMRRNIINLKVELAKTILTPGENINLSYVITNQSSVAVNAVRIELLTKTKYTADCGRTNVYEKVYQACTVRQKGCDSDSVDKNRAVVPTLAELYTIQNTKVIEKKYFVRVTLELPLLHINGSAELEVVIGEMAPEVDLPPPYSDESDIKILEK